MSNLGDFKRGLTALAQATGGLATINQAFSVPIGYAKTAADGMASTTTAATLFWVNPFDFALKIVSARLVSASALTADATNYGTVLVQVDDGANGTPATALTWETSLTGTGNWVADTAESATVTAANAVIAAGACLHFTITKAGSGVVIPALFIQIVAERAE
jgi:hypothetical protein